MRVAIVSVKNFKIEAEKQQSVVYGGVQKRNHFNEKFIAAHTSLFDLNVIK